MVSTVDVIESAEIHPKCFATGMVDENVARKMTDDALESSKTVVSLVAVLSPLHPRVIMESVVTPRSLGILLTAP